MSNRILLSIIAGLLLALFGLLLIVVYQRGKLDAVPPSVRVSGVPESLPPTQSSPASAPPISPQSAAQNSLVTPMPPDVVEYLTFLKGIEDHKQQIIARQQGESRASYIALSASNDNRQNAESSKAILNQSHQLEGEWEEFTNSFRQKTPPAPCADLFSKYADHLYKIRMSFVKVSAALQLADSDASSALEYLRNMEAKGSDVPEAADAANDALTKLCSTYKVSPPFTIK